MFDVRCFIWHYPAYTIPVLIITLDVFKNEIVNGFFQWKRRLRIYLFGVLHPITTDTWKAEETSTYSWSRLCTVNC